MHSQLPPWFVFAACGYLLWFGHYLGRRSWKATPAGPQPVEKVADEPPSVGQPPRKGDPRTDPATGLCGELAMGEWLRMMFGLMLRYDRSFSMAIVELDPVESVTRQEDANEYLRRLARVLNAAIRDSDVVFHLTTNQLIIALPETDLQGAIVVANRILSDIKHVMDVTASIGVSAARDDDSSQTLLERLQTAPFAAKSAGGNRFFIHTGVRIESGNVAKRETEAFH